MIFQSNFNIEVRKKPPDNHYISECSKTQIKFQVIKSIASGQPGDLLKYTHILLKI